MGMKIKTKEAIMDEFPIVGYVRGEGLVINRGLYLKIECPVHSATPQTGDLLIKVVDTPEGTKLLLDHLCIDCQLIPGALEPGNCASCVEGD